MTDIKEPINTTSDGTFLSVVCENPKKVLLAKSWGGGAVAPPAPPGITPLHMPYIICTDHVKLLQIFRKSVCLYKQQNSDAQRACARGLQ